MGTAIWTGSGYLLGMDGTWTGYAIVMPLLQFTTGGLSCSNYKIDTKNVFGSFLFVFSNIQVKIVFNSSF